MSYCDDCGLSSCYERGGYCERSCENAAARAKQLKPRSVKWASGEWLHVRLTTRAFPEQDDWIEYIPAPAPDTCLRCGPDPNVSCWLCR